jgi:outer membrane protein TolC
LTFKGLNICIRCLAPATLAGTLLLASQAVGQSSTPTPTPDTTPVPRTFDIPLRPLPSPDRVGVDTDNQLPLTLDQAIEMALKNSNDIEASRKDVRINEFTFRAARGVYDPVFNSEDYYESVTTPTASSIGGAVNGAVTQKRLVGNAGVSGFSPFAGGSYSSLFNSSRSTTSNTNAFLNPQYPSSLEFAYTQPLFRNRSIDANRRTIEIARKNIEISNAQLRLRAITIISGVEQAYWDLVFAMRNLQVQMETLRQAREQLESNRRMVAQGVLAPIEIVAATAQVTTFEQAVYTAQESITRAENTLKTVILPDRNAPEWNRPLTPVTPAEKDVPQIGVEVAVSEAIKNRPEIAQLETTAAINQIDQRYFRDQTKPQIDLVTNYTAQGLAGSETPAAINPITGMSRVPPNLVGGLFNSLGNLAALRYPSYRVGVNISLPFRNTTAKANLGRSIVQGEQIGNNRAQTEENIAAEVRNALQALRSAEARLRSATDARAAAEELYASEVRQFRAGTTTFYLVLQRQTDLSAARGREIQARTDLNKAISEFERSIGNTLTYNNVSISH